MNTPNPDISPISAAILEAHGRTTPDPLAVAETVLAPLRMLFAGPHPVDPAFKPPAIAVTPEQFNAIVKLPVLVRELREALQMLLDLNQPDYEREFARKALEGSGG